MDTHLGTIAGFSLGLVFTKPIVGISLYQDTTSMCIDMDSLVVRSQFAGRKHVSF